MLWFSGGAPERRGRVARAVRMLRRARARRTWRFGGGAPGARVAEVITIVKGARPRLVRITSSLSAAGTGLVLRAAPAVAQVTLEPDAGQGPGGPQFQQLVNWIAGMGLIACTLAVVYHAVGWAMGSHQHNMARVQDGKSGVARAAGVGGIIGAAAALVNFAVNLGGQVQ